MTEVVTLPRAPERGAGILVVEDSATQAAALGALLEEVGYTVRVARSGEQALDMLASDDATASAYDLVLSDVVMPGIDGYELCRRIKTTLGRADLPVVLLTSLTDPLDIVRGLESGADNYVTKPYEPARLLARLRTVLDGLDARRSTARGQPVKVSFQGVPFTIAADKEQILDLLVSSYEDLVRTSKAVRTAERRARFLADAGERFASSLDPEVILRDLARIAVPSVADVAVVDALEPSGRLRRVEQAGASAATGVTRIGALPVVDAVARATAPLLVPDVASLAADAAALAPLGVRSVIVAPLVARGNTLGTLTLGAIGAEPFRDDDLALAVELARRAAMAVDNARLYREAQRASRARDDVLAIVSHDLRNPLHTIGMSAAFLAETLDPATAPSPDLASQLGVIRRAVARANTLIQDLLDVSRIDAGSLAVDRAPVSAAALLEEAAAEMAPLARGRGVRLAHAWRDGDAIVDADRARIAQVFSNLVGNALKFTPAGGGVELTGDRDGDRVWFSVRDDGAGIPADHLPHLFDRYWQAKRGGREGAGLGLFITRGIVEAHGGTIAVESAPGQGSTFRFSVPVAGPA